MLRLTLDLGRPSARAADAKLLVAATFSKARRSFKSIIPTSSTESKAAHLGRKREHMRHAGGLPPADQWDQETFAPEVELDAGGRTMVIDTSRECTGIMRTTSHS